MVLLDVVYNHFGPDGNYLGSYAQQFFTERHKTPWGNGAQLRRQIEQRRAAVLHPQRALLARGISFRRPAARRSARDSRRLRPELPARARRGRAQQRRPAALRTSCSRTTATMRHFSSATPRAARSSSRRNGTTISITRCYVLLTGETRGHYADYSNAGASYLRSLREGFVYQGQRSAHRGGPRGSPSGELPPEAFVNFLQNHDQVGNRPDAARMWALLEPARMSWPPRRCSRCYRRRSCCSWATSSMRRADSRSSATSRASSRAL